MLYKIKHHLAAVFDDNLHTRKWHNLADYLIIAMIVASTLEIFISTFDVPPTLRKVLFMIDIITLVFFTIEVTLRIWVAPLVDPKFKGWKGRLRYCTTFHGFIDIVSTYPYYLQWIIPFPITWLKLLRISRTMRLFRISRYMKSWRLLTDTIKEKKRELIISMQFLIIITLILSLILFFFEHERQPDVYDNGFSSVMWAFAQYIGDPGGFGDTPPVSVAGRIIACIVGLLGIAIVAVPAGILGAGFTEAIEKENNKEQLAINREKLRLSFERKLDRPTGFQAVPPFCSISHIQARQGMTTDEIIAAVNDTDGYRLVNLATTIPLEKNPTDRLAVEHFSFNRPYGLLIDRQSKVTVIAPSSFIDACTGFFAYYLAKIGGFNYVSREFGRTAPYKSFFTVNDNTDEKGFDKYVDDLKSLLGRPGAWSVTSLVSSGSMEPEYDTQIHFGTGNGNGDESIGDLITDKDTFARFYHDISTTLSNKMDIKADCGRYHNTSNPNILLRKIPTGGNDIVMRTAWDIMLWDSRRLIIAQTIARAINREILGLPDNPDDPSLKTKEFGY